MSKPVVKLLVVLNYSNSLIGGAPKRYINLFFSKLIINPDYYLVINATLWNEAHKFINSIPNERIIIIDDKKPWFVKLKFGELKTFLSGLHYWLIFSGTFLRLSRKYNVVCVYGVYTGGIYASIWKRVLKFRFIYSYNDSSFSSLKKGLLKLFNSELLPLKLADKVDFLSEGLLQGMSSHNVFIDYKRRSISPCSFITNTDKYFPSNNKYIDVLFVSRLTSYKNPMIFINAINLLKEKLVDFGKRRFIILGDGPLYNDCIKLKNSYGLTNLEILGSVPDVYKYMNESRIFVSIQRTNNYPSQSLMEAMQAGNAIIASDVGETSLLVTDKEGILIQLSTESLSFAIRNLLSNPERCMELGVNARKKVMNEHNIENYYKYFIQLTDGSGE